MRDLDRPHTSKSELETNTGHRHDEDLSEKEMAAQTNLASPTVHGRREEGQSDRLGIVSGGGEDFSEKEGRIKIGGEVIFEIEGRIETDIDWLDSS
nr:hypothetical protein CFP56_17315 [Quercus suber]